MPRTAVPPHWRHFRGVYRAGPTRSPDSLAFRMDISVRRQHRGLAPESASRQSKTADGFDRLNAASPGRDIEEPDRLTHALERDPAQILELEVPLDEPRRVLRETVEPLRQFHLALHVDEANGDLPALALDRGVRLADLLGEERRMGWRWNRRPPADRPRRTAAATEVLADLDRGAARGTPNLVPHCVQKRRSDRLS